MPADPVESTPVRPARLARRGRWIATVAVVMVVGVAYAAFFGDTRWRVWLNQKVWVPPSARDLRCTGHTLSWLGDTDSNSTAEFTLPEDELPQFLSTFKDVIEYPQTGSSRRVIEATSPTGIDHVFVEWRSTGGGRATVRMNTSWN